MKYHARKHDSSCIQFKTMIIKSKDLYYTCLFYFPYLCLFPIYYIKPRGASTGGRGIYPPPHIKI